MEQSEADFRDIERDEWRRAKHRQRALIDRLAVKFVFSPSGCWDWIASGTTKGYGKIWYGQRTYMAHRLMYEFLVGPIPDGLTIDHLCQNRSCVNPAHLEPVSLRANLLRGGGFSGINARKTHCPNGHAYDEKNTRTRSGTGWRACRACDRDQQREKRRREKSGSK